MKHHARQHVGAGYALDATLVIPRQRPYGDGPLLSDGDQHRRGPRELDIRRHGLVALRALDQHATQEREARSARTRLRRSADGAPPTRRSTSESAPSLLLAVGCGPAP